MKIFVFENDSDFESYCLNSGYEMKTSEVSGTPYFDLAFSDMYLDDIRNGNMFCISDPNSLVTKRKSVTRGVVSKKVENLLDLTEEELPIYHKDAEIVKYTQPNNI